MRRVELILKFTSKISCLAEHFRFVISLIEITPAILVIQGVESNLNTAHHAIRIYIYTPNEVLTNT